MSARFGMAVEYVADIEAAMRFYVDTMGLKIERHHPTFVQFEHFAIATDAPMSGESQELYWLVEDADAAFRALPENAEVCLPVTQKPFGKLFALTNADGRPRYVLELARSRPSTAAS